MGAMLADGGKTLAESDPEVSEAIDFCRFYADSAQYFHELPGVAAQRQGRGRRRLAVEFSAGDSLRRRRGGARGRQHRDPQAGVRHGAHRVPAVPMLLAGRRAEDGAAIRAVQRRHGRASGSCRTTASTR